MSHETFLRKAISLAEEHSAEGRSGPFGAIVVLNGEIVGEGWNQVVDRSDPTAHAEILAIRDACERLGRHSLDHSVIYCSTEPCPMCLSAIYWARIPKVFFACSRYDADVAGFDDSLIYTEMSRGWEERILDGTQMLREEGFRVLERWMENPEKVEY
ncbi:nucleoside deaminase [Gemmatimonadota bacterium]